MFKVTGCVLPKNSDFFFPLKNRDLFPSEMYNHINLSSLPVHLESEREVGKVLKSYTKNDELWVECLFDSSTINGEYALNEIFEGNLMQMGINFQYQTQNFGNIFAETRVPFCVTLISESVYNECTIKEVELKESTLVEITEHKSFFVNKLLTSIQNVLLHT